MRAALFPGSFDPMTIGHVDIINRSINLFDKIIIGIGVNTTKQTMFGIDQRIAWIKNSFEGNTKIAVASYTGLTVDFCRQSGAQYILRGLRTSTDFQFEKAIAQMNHYLNADIETVFILASPEYAPVSSSIVRDLIRNGADAKRFLAPGVKI